MSYLPQSKTRFLNRFSKPSRTSLITSFWTLTSVSNINWSWTCTAVSTSPVRLSSPMVKNLMRCTSYPKVLPSSMIKRVLRHSFSYHSTRSLVNTSSCSTSDPTLWSKSVVKKIFKNRLPSRTKPPSSVSLKTSLKDFLVCSQNRRLSFKRELLNVEESSWTTWRSLKTSWMKNKRKWKPSKRREWRPKRMLRL